MTLYRENIYWLFSTSLQVIATFVGLLAAGYFFTHGKIDEEVKKDDTLLEIYMEIKRQYYVRFRTLFTLTAFSITLGLCVLFLNAFDVGWFQDFFVVIVALLNLLTIIWAGRFFIFIIDPEIISHTADRLVKENKDIFTSKGDHGMTRVEFIDKFTEIERLLRSIIAKSKHEHKDNSLLPFADMIKELYAQKLINAEQLKGLNRISKARNISSHSDIENIEQGIGTSADKLNQELNVINDKKAYNKDA